MQIEQLKKCNEWFRVEEYKDVRDPSGQMARKELLVSLDQYPHNFGLGPNPREPDPTSRVSKRIGETLEQNWGNFHHLNRGVTVVAKRAEYDNKSQRVRLVLDQTEEEKRLYGILDGGNTNERINMWRKDLPDEEAPERLPRTFLNMQILIPHPISDDQLSPEMVNLLNDVKDARNTSVQVKTKSLADARRHFDALKAALEAQTYFQQIMWHEGQKGTIDALDIIILLMIFYPSFCKAADGEPSNAYGHKERCLDAFLQYSEKEGNQLVNWIKILPTILSLYDRLQATFCDQYPGSFGKINEVKIYDVRQYEKGNKKYSKTPFRTQFLGKEVKYSYPRGWLYPLYAGFRILAAPNEAGDIEWRRDPVEFWQKHGGAITASFVPHMVAAGYEPKKIATNPLCYQAVRQTINDLYKDEILREHGISV
jgi:hypothetical protein